MISASDPKQTLTPHSDPIDIDLEVISDKGFAAKDPEE
jgi:hypothetical protein